MIDASVCPLCGGNNSCANLDSTAASDCWCMATAIPALALAQLPLLSRGKSCICSKCAKYYQSLDTEHKDMNSDITTVTGVSIVDPAPMPDAGVEKSVHEQSDPIFFKKVLRIGILNADDVRQELSPKFGQYPNMFEEVLGQAAIDLGIAVDFQSWNVHRGEYPQSLDLVDGFVITGCKQSVYDDEPWIQRLGQFVETLHLQQKKLIGICFGHQLVAHQLGGHTAKSDKGWMIGCHQARFTQDCEYGAKGESFNLLSSHQDQVMVAPKGAKILAQTDLCPISMMQIDSHILTVQSHPEFSVDYAAPLYQLRQASFSPQLFQSAQASLAAPLDRVKVSRWLLEFLIH